MGRPKVAVRLETNACVSEHIDDAENSIEKKTSRARDRLEHPERKLRFEIRVELHFPCHAPQVLSRLGRHVVEVDIVPDCVDDCNTRADISIIDRKFDGNSIYT